MVIDLLYCVNKTAVTITESQYRYSGSIHTNIYCTLPAPTVHRGLLDDLIHNEREVITANRIPSCPTQLHNSVLYTN